MATIHHFRDAAELCLTRRPDAFMIDFTPLTFLGSEGIRALLMVVQTCRDRSVTLDVRVGEHAARVLDLAGLAHVIPYTSSIAASLGGPSFNPG